MGGAIVLGGGKEKSKIILMMCLRFDEINAAF
jgi:hypothetical protein